MKVNRLGFMILFALLCYGKAFAAHPLITDDAGTQGKGKLQIEVNGEIGIDEEDAAGIAVKERVVKAATIVSFGLAETVDAVVGAPYQWVAVKEDGVTTSDVAGAGDVMLELKWRFYEKDGLSIAVKPGVSVPTGDEQKGLGAGKYGFSTHLIATQEMEPWVFHLNLGYIRNNNRADERENLYHVSLATEYRIKDAVRIVANIGQDHNPDRTTDRKPVFALAGVIYSIFKDMDIDIGFKAGITDPETDRTVLAGMAWRF